MANHSIKIKGVADFSGISKEVQSLHQTMNKAFGKSKNLFDVKELKEFSHQSSTTFAKLTKDFAALKKEAQALTKEMKKAGSDESKVDKLIEKRTENLKKQVLIQRDLAALKKMETRVAGVSKNVEGIADVIPINRKNKPEESFGGMAKDTAFSGAKDVASELPGIAGPASSVAGSALEAGGAAAEAGLGAAAVAGLGALAVVAGAAVVAITRMKAGFEEFQKVMPDMIKLAGMGVTVAHGPGNKAIQAGAQFGFAEPEVLKLQEQENQAFGRAKSPEQDNNRLTKIMGASRLLGVQPEQVTQGGNQLRALGGGQMAQREMGLILEKAVASGMDKTQASAYLASAVGLLATLNDSGVGNTNALLSTMTDLVSKGNMSPEQAAKSLGGLNASIAGSSGEANAFFQGSMVKAGLGGGTLSGTQFAVRQGLVGLDEGDLRKQVGDTDAGRTGIGLAKDLGLTDKNYSQKAAGGILKQAKQIGGNDPQTMFTFMSKMFGVKTLGDTVKAMSLLEKISKTSDKKTSDKLAKDLVDLGKGPEEKWRFDVLEELKNIQGNTAAKNVVKTAITTAESKANAENAQVNLGAEVAPAFDKLRDGLTHLNNTLAGLTDALTHSTIGDITSGIANIVGNLISAIGDGFAGLFKKMMTVDFWMSDSSLKGGTNEPIPTSLSPQDKDAAYKYLGVPKPADAPQAKDPLPPTKTSTETGLSEHGPAMLSALQRIAKNTEKPVTAAPRGGRDLSRP